MNNGKAAFPEFHNGYIDPASYDHWTQHGEWRDGTILIKELVSVGSKSAVSGKGYFMGDFIGMEATIKSEEHPQRARQLGLLQLHQSRKDGAESHRDGLQDGKLQRLS